MIKVTDLLLLDLQNGHKTPLYLHCLQKCKNIGWREEGQYVQVHMRKTSRRNRDSWNRSMNMGLDLAPMTMETGTSPETHVP